MKTLLTVILFLAVASSASAADGFVTKVKICTEFVRDGITTEVCNDYPWLTQPKSIEELMQMNSNISDKLEFTPSEDPAQ